MLFEIRRVGFFIFVLGSDWLWVVVFFWVGSDGVVKFFRFFGFKFIFIVKVLFSRRVSYWSLIFM